MKQCYFGILFVIALLQACGGQTTTKDYPVGANEYNTTESVNGIQSMSPYHYSDTIRTGGKVYVYTIHREASDSLPVVTDDEGNKYADNVYTLTIRQGERMVFNRQFTKKTVASYLSKEFQQKGILDGMMCDKSLPGLRFAISVSLPQSDMFEPLLLQVDNSGGMTISLDERGEAELEDEGV